MLRRYRAAAARSAGIADARHLRPCACVRAIARAVVAAACAHHGLPRWLRRCGRRGDVPTAQGRVVVTRDDRRAGQGKWQGCRRQGSGDAEGNRARSVLARTLACLQLRVRARTHPSTVAANPKALLSRPADSGSPAHARSLCSTVKAMAAAMAAKASEAASEPEAAPASEVAPEQSQQTIAALEE